MTSSESIFRVVVYPEGIIIDKRYDSIKGIVFERYIDYLLNDLQSRFGLEKISLYSRRPLAKILEDMGLNVEGLYSAWANDFLFPTPDPFLLFRDEYLRGIVISEERSWWERKVAQDLLDRKIRKIVIEPFEKDKHRPDFVFIGRYKDQKVYIFLGDAKFRESKESANSKKTVITTDDIKRLTIYSRILNAFVMKKGWEIEDIYVFGNWEGVTETSYRYAEETNVKEYYDADIGEMVEEVETKKVLESYRAFYVEAEVVEDNLFGQVTELKIYPKSKDENDPPFLKIRYVPMPYLIDKGWIDDVINVVVIPKEKADKEDPNYTKYKYFIVSRKFKTERWIEYNWGSFDQRKAIEGYILYESSWNDLKDVELATTLRKYNPAYSIKELEKKPEEEPKVDYKLKIRPKNPKDISAWLSALVSH